MYFIRFCFLHVIAHREYCNVCVYAGGEVDNVRQYLERIRNLYWPDWDQLLAR